MIEGIYIGHIDNLGALVIFAQSTTGMILFIGLPILVYVIFDFTLHARERKREREKNKKLQAELEALLAQQKEKAE